MLVSGAGRAIGQWPWPVRTRIKRTSRAGQFVAPGTLVNGKLANGSPSTSDQPISWARVQHLRDRMSAMMAISLTDVAP